jgi:plastocyanin
MDNRRVSYLVLAVGLVTLLGVSGLGIASAQSGTTTNVKITETEFKLDPAMITVPVNTPVHVTVTNAGSVEHNLKFELPAQNIAKVLFDQNLKPGETKTATFTFTAAGQWQMFCPVDAHESAGMKGTVMVVGVQGAVAGTTASTRSGAIAAATATPARPRTLPVTGGELPAGALVLAAGLVALLAGMGLRIKVRSI